MTEEMLMTVLEPRPQSGFVETGYVESIMARAHSYLEAGFPVHFRGGSGTGKTTFAMHLAHLVGRPVVLIHGDEEFSSSQLVGGEHGYHLRKVVDNFIHSVLKTEEDFSRRWVDSRLTQVCKYGFTLVYDEFTRSRPEANNVLLAILQEGILELPSIREGEGYLRVDPRFRAIFTSNPEEYAGTYKAQDALRDRMITIDLHHFDRDTEVAITQARAGLSRPQAERIVDLVRAFREKARHEFAPTVRAAVMIATVSRARGAAADARDQFFRETCVDVLCSETSRGGIRSDERKTRALIHSLVDKFCSQTLLILPESPETWSASAPGGRELNRSPNKANTGIRKPGTPKIGMAVTCAVTSAVTAAPESSQATAHAHMPQKRKTTARGTCPP